MSAETNDTTCEVFASELEQFLNSVIVYSKLNLHILLNIKDSQVVRVNFTGPDVPLLTSQNAELLHIIEYIASRVFTRYLHGDIRMVFDAGNYKIGREHELTLIAKAAAEKVKKFQQPFTLNAMNSFERRVVHLVLNDDPNIRTESIGNGENRKIIIYPV